MDPGFWQYKPPSIGDLPAIHGDSWNVIETIASIPYVPSNKSYFLEASSLLSLVSPALMRGKICPNMAGNMIGNWMNGNSHQWIPYHLQFNPYPQSPNPVTQPFAHGLWQDNPQDPFLFFQYWISGSKFICSEKPRETYHLLPAFPPQTSPFPCV
jgi:hypothetical protein